jgi:hypothetical protein
MDVEVREARPEDYAAWLALWQGYLDFAGSTLSDVVTRATWARIHSPNPHCYAVSPLSMGNWLGLPCASCMKVRG